MLPLWIDAQNQRVWRGNEVLTLSPKPFAALRHLINHANQLVTKEELIKTVWQGTAVSDDALVACIRRIRIVLGDTSQKPCSIETVHRHGYRFIGPLAATAPPSVGGRVPVSHAEGKSEQAEGVVPQQDVKHQKPETILVGRATELERLHGCLAKALNGERQIIFVTGEPGIGKTTLLDAFIEQAATQDQLVVARGHYIEQ